eukprot:TRINITY_DN61120_c0_g1_i1.p1 TRINITY_DN61120_c0_g1~~TRINITY_DN61120_c0_g1_i1.p1  ORF type:complete len:588 (+),score=87.52 TRINITY_DN61120_c0_g1_i1:46-1809(+)
MACADGLLVLLGLGRPHRKEVAPDTNEEFPIVCKWASLLDSKAITPPPCHPAPKPSLQIPSQGDLVILSKPLKPEFHLCPAVVVEVKSARCSVAILDPSRSFRIGECQAHVSDLQPIHSEWRLGGKLVITGLGHGKMKHLNGLSATVCEHKRHGHPCFIQKGGDANADFRLKICVQWHDPQVDESGAVLLEPRQLAPFSAQRLDEQPPSNTSWGWPQGNAPEENATLAEPASAHQQHHDTTLLTASRRQAMHIEKVCRNLPSLPGTPSPVTPLQTSAPMCAGGLLGFISWMVESHARPCEAVEDWPTVCKMTSVIAVDQASPRKEQSTLMTIPEYQEESMQGQQHEDQVSTPSTSSWVEPAVQGDLVILGRRVQPEFQLCWAVVRSVEETSCRVAVLDATKSFCIGECCPEFSEILPVNSDWRVGSRLIIGGLQSSHMKHLNGLIGVVHPHRRHGHPCFLPRPGDSDDGNLWLNICLRLEDPEKASMHAVLLEPSLLTPCAQVLPSKTLAKPVRKTLTHKSSGYEKNLSLASTASGGDSYSRTSSLPSSASFGSSTEMSPGQRIQELDELKQRLMAMAQQSQPDGRV